MPVNLGAFLFRCRAWIAVPFFIFLVLFSRPGAYPGIAYALIITGCAMRIWAAGYIGVSARKTPFGTSFLINSGPYKYLRHPLYIGNSLLVAGVTILFNPPSWYVLIIIILFTAIYGLVIVSEQAYIRQLLEKKVGFKFKNCFGEISTMIVLVVIILIHMLVPKNLLLKF
ncbi:hypothetical protein JXB22_06170 [candidate division WOR-3 bacterium]|nr:hypothetical protein [candidate division WOR-3 bacterium]